MSCQVKGQSCRVPRFSSLLQSGTLAFFVTTQGYVAGLFLIVIATENKVKAEWKKKRDAKREASQLGSDHEPLL